MLKTVRFNLLALIIILLLLLFSADLFIGERSILTRSLSILKKDHSLNTSIPVQDLSETLDTVPVQLKKDHSLNTLPVQPKKDYSLNTPVQPKKDHSLNTIPVQPKKDHSLNTIPVQPKKDHSLNTIPVQPKKDHSLNNIPVQLKKDRSLNTHNDIFDSVKKLLLFVGWPQSCHSFVGSILDGHPHILVADEYFLMTKLRKGQLPIQRDIIFKALYNSSTSSIKNTRTMRAKTEHMKGYSLLFEDLMQGQFEDHIDIIGDKAGAHVSMLLNDKTYNISKTFGILKKQLRVDIYVIRVVRNPYDNIATDSVYKHGLKEKLKEMRSLENTSLPQVPKTALSKSAVEYFRLYFASEKVKAAADKTIDVHCSDLIDNPKEEIIKLCEFLEVQCSEDYISKCASHVFTEESHTSKLINWPPEVKESIQHKLDSIPLFKAYNYKLLNL